MSVEVAALHHRYGKAVALEGVSFAVRAGEIFALAGPNGGGKTTLFKILSTALAPTSGTARLGGLDVRDPVLRRQIGVVFQSPSLDRKLTVRENLLHQGHLYGLRGGGLRGRIDELLGRFGLSDRAPQRVEVLSGGLQRRVELAKALLHRPAVLLLDEPSTGLDPRARREFWDFLRGLAGVTVLLTTHLLEEAERSDRMGILHRGRLVAFGEPQTLRSEVGGDVVTVRGRDPAQLCEAIRAKFGVDAQVVDGTVRLSRDRGHEFAARLADAFPGELEAVTVAKPSLEDVFHARTREVWA